MLVRMWRADQAERLLQSLMLCGDDEARDAPAFRRLLVEVKSFLEASQSPPPIRKVD